MDGKVRTVIAIEKDSEGFIEGKILTSANRKLKIFKYFPQDIFVNLNVSRISETREVTRGLERRSKTTARASHGASHPLVIDRDQ